MKIASNPNSLILDFFAGSGTTGQAVLEMNKRDKQNLHWGFVRDKDNQIYINNTEFAEDMADEHWVPLTQEF